MLSTQEKKKFKLVFDVYTKHIMGSIGKGNDPTYALKRVVKLVKDYRKKIEI